MEEKILAKTTECIGGGTKSDEGYLDRVDALLIRMATLVEHISNLCEKVGGGTTDEMFVCNEGWFESR